MLWNKLVNFLTGTKITVALNFQDVCFGINTKSIYKNVINLMILVMKYYIIQMKFRKQLPTFINYKNYLNKRIQIEQAIALIHNKLEQNNKKWAFLT